jgi:hypothetical protein
LSTEWEYKEEPSFAQLYLAIHLASRIQEDSLYQLKQVKPVIEFVKFTELFTLHYPNYYPIFYFIDLKYQQKVHLLSHSSFCLSPILQF